MKIKKTKQMLAMLLSSSMLLSAAAGFSVAAEDTTEANGYAEEDMITLKLFVDEIWWPYTEWSGRIPDQVSKKFGIKFDVTVPSDVNQLNMMIASGDLGDLVCSGKFSRLCDNNICYTLDELADEYDMDLGIHSVMRFVNTADDGNLYTLMAGYSPDSVMKQWDKVVYERSGMQIREDIYEELGSPAINTLEDLTNLLQMVKDNYPDIVPFAYNYSWDNDYLRVLTDATVNVGGFEEVDGKAVPFILDPNLKDYYKVMNDWYRRGFMTDENFAWTGSEDEDLMMSGKLFSDSFNTNTGDTMNAKLEAAGADFRLLNLIDLTTGEPKAHWTSTNVGWRGLFIPKSCSDPKRVLEFIKWAWSEEGQRLLLWGEEGIDWQWSEDGTYPIMNYNFEDPDQSAGVKYWGWLYHDGKNNVLPGVADPGTNYEAHVALKKICDVNPVLGMLRMGADSNEQVIMDSLHELYINESTNIITAPNDEEFEARYENMIQTANDMGAEQLTEWANAKYIEKKEEYDKIKDNVE